jgi:sialidase-1
MKTTRTATLAALLVLGACRTMPPADAPERREASFDVQDLFTAGDGGYAFYRIPALAVTQRGVLVACAEARKDGAGDWGSIDVLMRRSSDAGRTWDAPKKVMALPAGVVRNPAAEAQKLGKPGEFAVHNPVLLADRAGGLTVIVGVEYARVFALKSTDDGVTFGAPVEITSVFEEFRKDYDWKVVAAGPGHGIQLANGRLVVSAWLSTGTGAGAHRPSCVATIVSDDAGRTWKRGEIVVKDPGLKNPSEATLVELESGAVMINVRHEQDERLRAVSTSKDGASGWTPVKLDSWLPETVCHSSLLRLTKFTSGGKSRLLFSHPHNPGRAERKNLTVKLSTDEGRTWPVYRVIEAGPAGYSDLALGLDGMIYCLFEKGSDAFKPRTISLARFNLEWVSGLQDSLKK